jgi:hypothetical protein
MIDAPPSYYENTIIFLSRWRERAGVRVDIISPLTTSLRHLPLAGPHIPCSVLWSGAAFLDLCKAVRNSILSPQGERKGIYFLRNVRKFLSTER